MIIVEPSLAERDPTIIGLATLLDGDLVAARLERHGIGSVRPTYVRYKPATSLIVGYRTSGGPIFGYAVGRESAPKLDKLIEKAPTGSVLAFDQQRRMIFATPAADRDLPGLRTALGRSIEPLAYKPQRRLVGRLRGRYGAPDRMLRCYRPADAWLAAPSWPSSELVADVRIPTVLDVDAVTGLVTVEWLQGTAVEKLTGDELIMALEAAGQALARWHGSAPQAPRPIELPDLDLAADQLIQLLPQERARITELARFLTVPVDVDHGWCHGDFSADQLLITDDGEISLLDWDRSGHGPLAVDLANAAPAGLHSSTELPAAGWQALLAGYQQIRPLPSGLDSYLAILRFTRAADPFRTATPDWPSAVQLNLDRVEAMLR